MDAPASAAQVPTTAPVIWIVATLMAGVLIGYLWARSRAMTKHRSATSGRAHERANWQAQVDREQGDVARLNGQLTSERAALAQARDDLKREQGTRNQLDQRMAPLQALVSKLSEQQADSERALQRSNTELREQITAMGTRLSHASNTFDAASKGVSTETRRLTQALSRSETRGTWGEMQLRRLVESAGMLNHVHFVEQDHIKTDLGTRRPDLVVDLAGGRRIVVDAKVPLDSYLRMGNGVSQEGTINSASHADAVANHIKELSKRAYWKHYDTPDFVVLFLPAESLLGTALEAP
jgi:DNA recombination protein RmuC